MAMIGEALGCSASVVCTTLQRAEATGERLPVATRGRPRKRPAPGATAPRRAARADSASTVAAAPLERPVTEQASADRPAPSPAPARALHLPEPRMWLLDDSPLPTDPDQALAELRIRRLPEFAKLVRYFLADGNIAEFRKALDSELAVVKAIRDATPPIPPDPQEDPANIDAQHFVRSKIASLRDRARKKRELERAV